MAKQLKKNERAYGEIVAKAWLDPCFKERLMAEPRKVLKEHGIVIPKGTKVRITGCGGTMSWDYNKKRLDLPMPPKPDLSDKEISKLNMSRVDCITKVDCITMPGV